MVLDVDEIFLQDYFTQFFAASGCVAYILCFPPCLGDEIKGAAKAAGNVKPAAVDFNGQDTLKAGLNDKRVGFEVWVANTCPRVVVACTYACGP